MTYKKEQKILSKRIIKKEQKGVLIHLLNSEILSKENIFPCATIYAPLPKKKILPKKSEL